MKKERKPVFKRSFIPRIFFVIISVALISTLNIIHKHQTATDQIPQKGDLTCQNSNNTENVVPSIPEINPHDVTSLTLYVCRDCPYCARVTNFLKQEKIDLLTINVEDNQPALEELVALTGGKQQVPCLKMGETHYLFESSEIIKQLKCVRRERPTFIVESEKKPISI